MNALASAVSVALRTNKPPREVTAAGLAIIQHAEGAPGTGAAMLVAYKDSKGIWTIGWGHIKGVVEGMNCSLDQAARWLDDDLDEAENAVCKYVTVPLNDNEFDALVSLVFNIGTENFRTSTLLRMLNAGNRAGAAAQFARWNKIVIKGKPPIVVDGLTNRRATEAALFVKPMVPGVVTMNLVQAELIDTSKMVAAPPSGGVIVKNPEPLVAPVMANEQPAAPPSRVTQTTTGKTGIAALIAGAGGVLTQGYDQAAPTINAVHRIFEGIGSSNNFVTTIGALLALGAIGAIGWGLWKEHRNIKAGHTS